MLIDDHLAKKTPHDEIQLNDVASLFVQLISCYFNGVADQAY
ncbi:hypothetical protein QN372_11900 [Undibacterium sp. RTI2.1]|nr:MULTISPECIES: hypothetical protein [unclassified Undibacterium]MEB0031452.1 hypothetical protein [Undibacterium sp. RTI2.1]MEB0116220.1 hypothetical protein [Undibacterium sp. RTI2.2]MEB0232927.1 hypothetical protein [Undibacterium sp. 10I3]